VSGPPEKVEAGAPHKSDRPATNMRLNYQQQNTAGTDKNPGGALQWLPCTWDHPQDLRSQLERRRQAAKRSVPLDCGCGTRDPLLHTCTQPPFSEHALDAWRDAAWHVLETGHMPLVPLEVRCALWRRPADRQLAELFHEGCGGAVA